MKNPPKYDIQETINQNIHNPESELLLHSETIINYLIKETNINLRRKGDDRHGS